MRGAPPDSSRPSAMRSTIAPRPRSRASSARAGRRIANIAAEMRHAAEQQFNARLRALGQAIDARSSPEPTGARLGQGVAVRGRLDHLRPSADIDRAGAIVSRYLEQANESLRKVFGTATLPDNVPPSAVQTGTPSFASATLTKSRPA